MHADIPNNKRGFIGNKRSICGYNVSDKSRAQKEHEVLKWGKLPKYVGIMCRKWVHRISYTLVHIILRKIDGEMF